MIRQWKREMECRLFGDHYVWDKIVGMSGPDNKSASPNESWHSRWRLQNFLGLRGVVSETPMSRALKLPAQFSTFSTNAFCARSCSMQPLPEMGWGEEFTRSAVTGIWEHCKLRCYTISRTFENLLCDSLLTCQLPFEDHVGSHRTLIRASAYNPYTI